MTPEQKARAVQNLKSSIGNAKRALAEMEAGLRLLESIPSQLSPLASKNKEITSQTPK